MASACLDRYTRIHSVFPPPVLAGQQQEGKGVVIDKVFMNSIPTTIFWDQNASSQETSDLEDDVWKTMKQVGSVGDLGRH
jgi:ribosome biogenesis protein NSA1